jgi:hypothetical protein
LLRSLFHLLKIAPSPAGARGVRRQNAHTMVLIVNTPIRMGEITSTSAAGKL